MMNGPFRQTRLVHVSPLFLALLLSLLAFSEKASARPVPQNLGNGLDIIVEDSLLQQGLISAPVQPQSANSAKGVVAKRNTTKNDTDSAGVQGKPRQAVNSSNYRFDVDLSGLIDGNDVSATQSETRSALP